LDVVSLAMCHPMWKPSPFAYTASSYLLGAVSQRALIVVGANVWPRIGRSPWGGSGQFGAFINYEPTEWARFFEKMESCGLCVGDLVWERAQSPFEAAENGGVKRLEDDFRESQGLRHCEYEYFVPGPLCCSRIPTGSVFRRNDFL